MSDNANAGRERPTCPVCGAPFDEKQKYGDGGTTQTTGFARVCHFIDNPDALTLTVYCHRRIPIKITSTEAETGDTKDTDDDPEVRTDGGTDASGRERFHLCLSCGRLKHEDLFGPGDCTCQDCYDEVDRGYRSSGIRYKETPDGEGFVLAGQNNSETNLEGSK